MKTRVMIMILLAALLVVPLGTVHSRATAQDGESPLLRLLAAVPDTENTREWVQFGDVAAWYAAWNIPRVPSLQALDFLPPVPHAYVVLLMPKQIAPPDALGLDTLIQGDQPAFYGFDFFDTERFIAAAYPPEDVVVVEHRADAAEVGDVLVASGYEAETLAGDWTLYSILGDYETAMATDIEMPFVGKLGQRNRIAIQGDRMIIGRATPPVSAALDVGSGGTPSLAGNPAFAAAAQALGDPSLADTGPLVGAIMMAGPVLSDPVDAMLGGAATQEQRDALLEELGELYAPGSLPVYDVVVFATTHSAETKATYLTLSLAFPSGTDAQAAVDVLVERMETYVSGRTGAPMAERWAFDRAAAVEVGGLPVALVTMRVDDPSPATDDSGRPNTAVLSWVDVLMTLDVGFLAAGEPEA